MPLPAAISLHFGQPVRFESDRGMPGEDKQRARERVTRDIMLRVADGFAVLGRPDLAHACRRRILAPG